MNFATIRFESRQISSSIITDLRAKSVSLTLNWTVITNMRSDYPVLTVITRFSSFTGNDEPFESKQISSSIITNLRAK